MAKDNKLIGLVLGQYEIVDFVGKGGMATVYRGIQKNVKRTVAIKVLPRNFTHDDTFMARFRREADLVASLEHPHIMPIYDYGEYDDMPYIVMRYIDGGSLHDRVRARTLSFEDIIRITRQIGGALDYAHQHNVLHRDVKPSNVMLDSQGNAYLTDFGLARLGESSTGSLTGSNIVGTPAYIAPEQAEQGPQAPPMDIYSLGVSVFEMLTGQIPYMADTPIAQILAHVQRPVPSARLFNMSVPPQADRVIQKAMAKRPEDRYKTASQLAMALEAALMGPIAEDMGFLELDQIPDHPTPIMLDPIPDIDFVVVPDPRTEPLTPKPAEIPSPKPAPLSVPVVDTPEPTPIPQGDTPSLVAEREHGEKRSRGRLLAILVVVGLVIGIIAVFNGLLNGTPPASPETPEPTEEAATPTEEQIAAVPTDETDEPTPTEEPSATPTDRPTETPTDEPTEPATEESTPSDPVPTTIARAIVQKGVDMLLVQEGLFIMGSRVGQQDEAPEHQVYLDTYYIDRTEVSIEDYMVCVAEGDCVDPAVTRSRTRSRYYDLAQYSTYPVINVTWEEAQAYCKWRGGHLPTEAQWEKAAAWDPDREGTHVFPWGTDLDAFYLNYGGTQIGDTSAVGSYPNGRSSYDVADMAGNVAEWVYDWYASNFYGVSPFANPVGPIEGTERVYRGGSYASFGAELRTPSRQSMAPTSRNETIGFRCAYTPSGDPTE